MKTPRPSRPAVEARLYSVPDADALVPYLREAFSELNADRTQLSELVDELAAEGLNLLEEVSADDVTEPRYASRFARVMTLQRKIRDRLATVQDLGVEVRDLDGLVDVRSRFKGREVCLCWQLGEDAFDHWHEVDGGFRGRQPIGDFSRFTGTLLN